MQQVSKVIIFFTRRKICSTSAASGQIRRVKKDVTHVAVTYNDKGREKKVNHMVDIK
jgi:hypothetical protein